MKKVFAILVLAVLISVSLAGGIQVIPLTQTSDGTAPIIQVARAEISAEQDSQLANTKNAFFTGISWSSKNPEDVEKYSRMADDLDAEWIKTYDGTNWFTGAWHVFLAKIGWKTSKNGLGATGNYDTVTGFSGGTRTAVTVLKQGKITANTLCLISPQVISAKELKSLIEKGRVKKIVVYQSDSDIFTSSHFKSQEGIEVSDFSGIKHGDWIDFVKDQIEKENISPELEIINPLERLVIPEGSPKIVGSESAYQLELDWIVNKIDCLEAETEHNLEIGSVEESISAIKVFSQHKEIYEKAYSDEQKITPPNGTEYLHECYHDYLKCSINMCEYWMKMAQNDKIYWSLDEYDPLWKFEYYSQIAYEYMEKGNKKSVESENYRDKIYAEYEK